MCTAGDSHFVIDGKTKAGIDEEQITRVDFLIIYVPINRIAITCGQRQYHRINSSVGRKTNLSRLTLDRIRTTTGGIFSYRDFGKTQESRRIIVLSELMVHTKNKVTPLLGGTAVGSYTLLGAYIVGCPSRTGIEFRICRDAVTHSQGQNQYVTVLPLFIDIDEQEDKAACS